MAFTVETGDGVEDANAYIALAYADTHHTDRGNVVWDEYSDPLKQAAIIRASDYIDKRFGRRFRGQRKLSGQGLEWPRLDAFDDDGFLVDSAALPAQLQKACAEYALRALVYNTLAPDAPRVTPDQDFATAPYERETEVTSGVLTQITEKVGPLSTSKSYGSLAQLTREQRLGNKISGSFLVSDFFIPEYPEADLWLESILNPPGNLAMIRA